MENNNNVGVALCGNLLKEAILNKTHYGIKIYAHILRQYNPDEVVFRLVGRNCDLCCNPFNSNKKTLHIFIKKSNPQKALSPEYARHTDIENAIPDGDAFTFAELHYKQQGDELLQTLNKELYLHIGEQRNFYKKQEAPINNFYTYSSKNPTCPYSLSNPHTPLFSFFKSPISNTIPHSVTTLRQIYNAITGNYYKERTQKLRAILSAPSPLERAKGEVARKFKAANFDYCTFSGIFTTRNDKALIKHSGLLCVDFDHLNNVEVLFNSLLNDDYFDTQLLFRSPSGNGLKWIISIDITSTTHNTYFTAVTNYILQSYGVEVDKSGKDISRACFLPYDPQAYINPFFLKQS